MYIRIHLLDRPTDIYLDICIFVGAYNYVWISVGLYDESLEVHPEPKYIV